MLQIRRGRAAFPLGWHEFRLRGVLDGVSRSSLNQFEAAFLQCALDLGRVRQTRCGPRILRDRSSRSRLQLRHLCRDRRLTLGLACCRRGNGRWRGLLYGRRSRHLGLHRWRRAPFFSLSCKWLIAFILAAICAFATVTSPATAAPALVVTVALLLCPGLRRRRSSWLLSAGLGAIRRATLVPLDAFAALRPLLTLRTFGTLLPILTLRALGASAWTLVGARFAAPAEAIAIGALEAIGSRIALRCRGTRSRLRGRRGRRFVLEPAEDSADDAQLRR